MLVHAGTGMKKNDKMRKNKYWHRARMTAFAVGAFCMMALPLVSVGIDVVRYYRIVAGRTCMGCYESEEEAARIVRQVRQEWTDNQEGEALSAVTCSIEPVMRNMVESTQENADIPEQLYDILEKNKIQSVTSAYVIKVNDFTVTVASEDAVVQTFQNIKNNYDAAVAYTITLEAVTADGCLAPAVLPVEGVDNGGIQEIGFEQEIQIVPAYVSPEEIAEPASAAAALTKEYETPTIYTVEPGDCLSLIAEKHNMKTAQLMELNQLTDSEWIYIGDELVVTVPQPEISVWYKQRAAYEEEYEADVIYQDNSSWYVGTEEVLQEGTTGRRQVVADVTYSNGTEVSREILEETLLAEAQPKIIERGTSTPPTYIKPLVGGSFSSPFGSRWGRMHKGVDWSCPIGTAVRASCGGTVISAGWVNGYGNCIMIRHSDGRQTRYAHLSKILVSSGQSVRQGEKIALSGNTGNSTGPHLHFEILVGGVQENPLKYLE